MTADEKKAIREEHERVWPGLAAQRHMTVRQQKDNLHLRDVILIQARERRS